MVPKQRKVSKLKLINKGHIPKIMVIAAVGTPVTGKGHSLEDKSNGKVGIWRVTQKRSVVRVAGAQEEKNITMQAIIRR